MFEAFDKVLDTANNDVQYFETRKTKNDILFNGIWSYQSVGNVKAQKEKLVRNAKYSYQKSTNKIKRIK